MNEATIDLELGREQVIKVKGNLDFCNTGEFSEALSRAVSGGRRTVIDLSGADMLDSGAIACLVAAHNKADDAGASIVLTGVSESVRRVLHMSGLASTFGLTLVEPEKKKSCYDRSELRRQDWRITESVVLAEEELVLALRDMAVAAAREAGLSGESVVDVRLAATEALANALLHGSPNGQKSKIGLRCLACPRAFVMEVSDEGAGLDEDAAAQGEPRAREGIGLRLIRQSMDEVEFLKDERGGRVRMLKWIREMPARE
ncbi:MAG: ATP-binding protein [Armatimonadetes bacterium]|nr:ATP-binding protein [Armatimonadota bacterium]